MVVPPRAVEARALDFDGLIALATLHRKAPLLEPAMSSIGLEIVTVAVDTNQFGTFTGDVERPGPAESVVVMKARAAAQAAGTSLGLASEGSFFPHPEAPMLTMDVELVAFVDLEDGLVVVGRSAQPAPWARSVTTDAAAASEIVDRFDLPEHAVVVRSTEESGGFRSDIRTPEELAAAMSALADADGRVTVESDLRADRCPSRHAGIVAAGWDLAARLGSSCGACGQPGMGLEREEPGKPCEWCGGPTLDTLRRIHRCAGCGHEAVEQLDGSASPGRCPTCNP